MANLLEMAAEIVAAHASTTPMSKEELMEELAQVHATLASLDSGDDIDLNKSGAEPVVTRKKAFGKDKITCMICGKSMKTLARHLKTSHDMKPGEYRKKFDIPRSQPLAAKNYSESRRQMAIDRGLGEKLAKARAARSKKK